MKINLKIDNDRLTFGDLLALEDAQEGKRPFHSLAQIIAKFITNEAGEFLESKVALDALKPLSLTQINEITAQFAEAVGEAQKAAVPLAKSDL